MYPRTKYEMTETDLQELMDACRATPCILVGDVNLGSSAQENANVAWRKLGEKMGFDSDTVRPIDGLGNRFFTAIPSETPMQRRERELNEALEENKKTQERLKEEIAAKEQELADIQTKMRELTEPT